MKYEIITDNEDLLVLTVNSRVISISQDMQTIIDTFTEDYTNYLNRKRKAAEKAALPTESVEITAKKDKEPDSDSLGKLFNL